jgi:uncharacterized membrane protein
MNLGGSGEVATLVADVSGSPEAEGVTATGDVPPQLAELIEGEISANYGAQNSGPHPAPSHQAATAFVAACTGNGRKTSAAPVPMTQTPAGAPPAACITQDGRKIAATRLRAVGTEPFWGARIEGRCVTYSHPEDQSGTRVWTRFSGSAAPGTWTGALGGKPFVLRTRPQAACSDGMSDRRYPIEVLLTVGGEERQGCAERL